jgi:hypothetical protein
MAKEDKNLNALEFHRWVVSQLSDEMNQALDDKKCPKCGKLIARHGMSQIEPNGHVYRPTIKADIYKIFNVTKALFSGWGAKERLRFLRDHKGIMFECRLCLGRWPYLKDSAEITPATAAALPKISDKPFISFDELELEEEPRGTESRLIDNSSSPVSVTRQILVKREWTRKYELDLGNKLTVSGEGSIGTELLARCKLKAEDEIKLKYSIIKEEKESFEEEISVEVPPRTKVRLIIKWKRLWQTGTVSFCLPLGKSLSVPYRVAKGITFDQRILEEA